MTVIELINVLQTLEPTATVILSRDEEGNGFSELETVEPGYFDGYEFEHEDNGEGKAVCLWP